MTMHFYGKMQQYREDEGIHYIPPFLLDIKCIKGVFADKKLKVSTQYICSVLRNDIGARYKTIKRVPYLGNS